MKILEKAEVFKKANRDYAKISAEKSFVLLKNENETLPISKTYKEVAVIGDLASNKKEMNGNWTGDGQPTDPITVLEALKAKFPNMKIRYEKGCDAYCKTDAGFKAAVDAAKDSDFTILVVGESGDMSAEAASRSEIDLPGMQTESGSNNSRDRKTLRRRFDERQTFDDQLAGGKFSGDSGNVVCRNDGRYRRLLTRFSATRIRAENFPLLFRVRSDKFRFITIIKIPVVRLMESKNTLQNISIFQTRRFIRSVTV